MKPVYMIFDYETFSECDLKKAGAFEYSVHPSTEILCLAFRIGTRKTLRKQKTKLVIPSKGGAEFTEFYKALMNPRIKLVAHNALFEQLITRNVYAKKLMYRSEALQKIPVSRWHCTAAMSRSVGLPGNLEGAGGALGLPIQKDKEGHRIMMKVCRPRKPTKNNPSTRNNDPADLAKLYAYCVTDVDAEVELFLKLPPLHPMEREFWILDQKMNLRGFAVDRKLVHGALKLIDRETKRLDSTIARVTGGALNSARQRDATLTYLRDKGIKIPNMQAATVKELLQGEISDRSSRQILEIREAISRSSTAKYKAFELRSRHDGRARDNTLFYGAHTGRQSGTGLQPQNLFKTVIPQKDVEAGLELIRNGDYHTIEALYDKPMDLYASALRSCIVAGDGKILDVGDFATIEVRVLFWLAGHEKGLQMFRDGLDLYLDMAAEIYGVKLSKLIQAFLAETLEAKNKRQLGKQTVLGAGFGIGVNGKRFQETAKSYGLEISLSLAQKAIYAYRQKHSPIPKFWETIERAAKLAVQNPGKAYKHGFLIWKMKGDWLTVKLPSGRRLSYFKPKLERTQTLYGPRITLTYKGVEPVSKKFIRLSTWGGKLTENVVQAVARDLLMEALLTLETRGISRPVLAVHDEIVSERQCLPRGNSAAHAAFLEAMTVVPAWAEGLPMKVEGWAEKRYRK